MASPSTPARAGQKKKRHWRLWILKVRLGMAMSVLWPLFLSARGPGKRRRKKGSLSLSTIMVGSLSCAEERERQNHLSRGARV